MQDRYAADVGDFGKYGLLRRLSGADPRLSLGIVWYLTDDEILTRDPVNDGRHIGYVRPDRAPRFEPCDPGLFASMNALLRAETRSVVAVEQAAVLPPETAFVSAHLRAPRVVTAVGRLRLRGEWLGEAAAAVRDQDIVFVDPDNGLEVPSVPITSSRAPKYTYYSDLDRLLRPRQTLVAYHHLGRSPHVAEVQRRLADLTEVLHRPAFALRFRRGTARAFLIVPAPDHADLLKARARDMLAGPWGPHFDWIDAPR